MKKPNLALTVTCVLVLACFALSASGALSQTRGLHVVVIAPSVSTSMEARSVRTQLGWIETSSWLKADAIQVVVRSSLLNPLDRTYECACELREDAKRQLNISGPRFHVYVYRLEEDLSVVQVDHTSYDAQ